MITGGLVRWIQKIKHIKNKLNKIEKTLETLETNRTNTENLMNDASFYTSTPKANAILLEYEQLKNTISQTEQDWEQTALELEELEAM